jgi:hypothetical protein
LFNGKPKATAIHWQGRTVAFGLPLNELTVELQLIQPAQTLE